MVTNADLFPAPKPSHLDKLPQELVDRILDFLPNRDTLLMLRAACLQLAAKTEKKFVKEYYAIKRWALTPIGWKDFIAFAKQHPRLASSVTNASLIAPHTCHPYESYPLAKGWGTGDALAVSCSKLQNITSLSLNFFNFVGSQEWLHGLCTELRLPHLGHLFIEGMSVEDIDLVAVLKRHKKKLHHIMLDRVNVHGGWNEWAADWAEEASDPEAGDMFRTPWSRVFQALVKLESDKCAIFIDRPVDRGREIDFFDLENNDLDDFDDSHPCMSFYGTTVHLVRDNPHDDDDLDMHVEIAVQGDEHWRKGVRRLIQMYEYPIYDPDRDGTPPWAFDNDSEVVDFETQKMKAGSAGFGSPWHTDESGDEQLPKSKNDDTSLLPVKADSAADDPGLEDQLLFGVDDSVNEQVVKAEMSEDTADVPSAIPDKADEPIPSEEETKPNTKKTRKRKASQLDQLVAEPVVEPTPGPRRSSRIKSR